MKFTRYSKFKGLDVSGINLGDLMDALSDSVLQSGYDEDYYCTRQRRPQDTSLDALRQALLQALMDQGLIDERQIEEMLADNDGQFKGSLLEEMLNQLIERLVEEGYLKLREEQPREKRQRQQQGGGRGGLSGLQVSAEHPREPRQIFGRPPRHAAPLDGRRGGAGQQALRVRRHRQPG